MKNTKILNLLESCYIELYNNSEPKGNWVKIKNNPDFDYNDYFLDSKIFDDIVEKYCKNIPKHFLSAFKLQVYLGPSPTSARTNYEEI